MDAKIRKAIYMVKHGLNIKRCKTMAKMGVKYLVIHPSTNEFEYSFNFYGAGVGDIGVPIENIEQGVYSFSKINKKNLVKWLKLGSDNE